MTPKRVLKAKDMIYFEQKSLFSGNLERFGEIWISIWIKCQRLQALVYLTFSSNSTFLKKKLEKFFNVVRKNFFCEVDALMFK